jgi:hypothetical protein
MGGLTVLAAAAVAAVAPVAETSRVQFTADTDISITHPTDSPNYRTVATDVTVSVAAFVRQPLVDDDAPLSLQPFLQRASVVYLSTTGGATTPYQTEPYPFASHREGASAGFNLYLARSFALTASFGVLAEDDHPPSNGGTTPGLLSNWLVLPVSLGFGVRWEDVRFDLSYHVVPTHDGDDYPRWVPPYFGNLSVSGYLVTKQRVSFAVEVDAIRSGAVASGELHFYFNRRLSLFVGAWGGRGVLYVNSYSIQNRGGAVLGLTGWLSRHLGFSLSYSPNWTSGPELVLAQPLGGPTTIGVDTMTHLFTFELLTRAR